MFGRTVLVATIALLVAGGPAIAQTDLPAAPRVMLVVLPDDEARALVAARGAALALGVDPRSRVPTRFVAAAVDDAGLQRPLAKGGIASAVGAARDAPPALRAAVEHGSGRAIVSVEEAIRSSVVILVLARADQVPASGSDNTLVLGVGRRTPLIVAQLGAGGALRAGDRPRPGIAVAADVRATLLRAAGVRSDRAGLSPSAEPTSLAALDRLTARFERDDASRYALAVALSVALYAPLAMALVAWRMRATRIVRRAAHAVALAPAGYLAGLFLAEASKGVRVLPVFIAGLGAAILPPISRATRLIGSALLTVAAVIAVGAIVAPFRPLGEPALTLWGSPLELNRTWGIVNSLAVLMAVGLVAGWTFARAPDTVLVVGGLVAAGVAGTGAVGANFVAPLWIIVIVWVAFAARRRGRIRPRDLLWAEIAGVAAFAVALAASLAGPESHGSAAAERILDHGLGAIWDLIRMRVEVNVREFTGRGVWFIVWTASMAIGLVIALGMAVRTSRLRVTVRPGYTGAIALTAGALAALVTEDTGVLVAPIPAAMAAAIWLHDRTRWAGDVEEVPKT